MGLTLTYTLRVSIENSISFSMSLSLIACIFFFFFFLTSSKSVYLETSGHREVHYIILCGIRLTVLEALLRIVFGYWINIGLHLLTTSLTSLCEHIHWFLAHKKIKSEDTLNLFPWFCKLCLNILKSYHSYRLVLLCEYFEINQIINHTTLHYWPDQHGMR